MEPITDLPVKDLAVARQYEEWKKSLRTGVEFHKRLAPRYDPDLTPSQNESIKEEAARTRGALLGWPTASYAELYDHLLRWDVECDGIRVDVVKPRKTEMRDHTQSFTEVMELETPDGKPVDHEKERRNEIVRALREGFGHTLQLECFSHVRSSFCVGTKGKMSAAVVLELAGFHSRTQKFRKVKNITELGIGYWERIKIIWCAVEELRKRKRTVMSGPIARLAHQKARELLEQEHASSDTAADNTGQTPPGPQYADLIKATERGTAFHALFQKFIEKGFFGERVLGTGRQPPVVSDGSSSDREGEDGATQDKSQGNKKKRRKNTPPSHPTVRTVWINNHAVCTRMERSDPGSAPQRKEMWYKLLLDPFSPEDTRMIIKGINDDLLCCKGVKGRSASFVSVVTDFSATNGTPAEFVVSRTSLYANTPGGVDATSAKLFKVARSIMEGLNKAIETSLGREFMISLDTNLIHYVAAVIQKAIYGAHNDCNCTITVDLDTNRVEVMDDRYLPTPDNAIILTMVGTNSQNPESTMLRITQEINGKDVKLGDVILEAGYVIPPLYENGEMICQGGYILFHIQGPGANSVGIEHHVMNGPNQSDKGTDWRFSATFRLTSNRLFNRESYDQLFAQALGRTVEDNKPDRDIDDYRYDRIIDRMSSYVRYDKRRKAKGKPQPYDEVPENEESDDDDAEDEAPQDKGPQDDDDDEESDGGDDDKDANGDGDDSDSEDSRDLGSDDDKDANGDGGDSDSEESRDSGNHDSGDETDDQPPKKKRRYKKKQTTAKPKPAVAKYRLNGPNNRDKYPTISDEDYLALGLYRPPQMATLTGTNLFEFFTHYTMVKKLFDRGFLVEVEKEVGPEYTTTIPCLHRMVRNNARVFPEPGGQYDLFQITADAGVVHSTQSHPITVAGELTNHFIVILSENYKNDWQSVLETIYCSIHRGDDGFDNVYDEEFDGGVGCNLCGGAPTKPGAQVPSAKSAHKSDTTIKVPAGQDPGSKINQSIKGIYEKGISVALYVREDAFTKGLKAHQHPYIAEAGKLDRKSKEGEFRTTFLGFYHGMVWKQRRMDRVVFIDTFKHEPADNQANVRFNLENAHECGFMPTLKDADWEVARQREDPLNLEVEPFRRLVVPLAAKNQTVQCLVPSHLVSKATGVHEDMVDRHFIEERLLKENYHLQYEVDEAGEPVFAEELEDQDDNGNDFRATVLEKVTTKASLGDLVRVSSFNCIAAALRFMEKNLVDKVVRGKTVRLSQPLVDEFSQERLPLANRLHPMQAANPDMECNFMWLRDVFSDMVGKEYNMGKRYAFDATDEQDVQDLYNVLVGVVIFRLTGKATSFHEWAISRKKDCDLPTVEEIPEWLEFVFETNNAVRAVDAFQTQWIIRQHSDSLPPSTKSLHGFRQFIKAFITRFTVVGLEQFLETCPTRYQSVKWLEGLISGCISDGAKSRMTWLCQKILFDVDGIFEEPFGTVDANLVVAGAGSKNGLQYLRNGGFKYKGDGDGFAKIVEYYHSNAVSVQDLQCQGFERRDDGKVYSVVTGRIFDGMYAEHPACELAKEIHHTFSNYTISKKTQSDKDSCHPLRIRPRNDSAANYHSKEPYISKHYDVVAQMFSAGNNGWNVLEIPEVIKYLGEADDSGVLAGKEERLQERAGASRAAAAQAAKFAARRHLARRVLRSRTEDTNRTGFVFIGEDSDFESIIERFEERRRVVETPGGGVQVVKFPNCSSQTRYGDRSRKSGRPNLQPRRRQSSLIIPCADDSNGRMSFSLGGNNTGEESVTASSFSSNYLDGLGAISGSWSRYILELVGKREIHDPDRFNRLLDLVEEKLDSVEIQDSSDESSLTR